MDTDFLFPNLNENKHNEMIPKWPDYKFPWSILDTKNIDNLNKQIVNFCNSSDSDISLPREVDIDFTNGPVFIHHSANISKYVKIEGPCFIGPNTEIRHSSYLRKGSWICEGAIVGHSSEIKNSVLLPFSKAPHFNYVGDSILGFGVNLGAGTKLSNVRNDKREVRVNTGKNIYVDSGLKKLGAMIGDYSELGCNVVTNPGTIILPKTKINPNSSLTGLIN